MPVHKMNTHAISPHQTPASPLAQDNHFKVLRLLAANPQLTQRELSEALGVSLGKINYCIQALLGKGLIKMESFRKSPNKLAYAYLLTPAGVAEKAGLTALFLARKVAEYESLRREIETLKSEIHQNGGVDGNEFG